MNAEEYVAAHPKRHRVDPLLGLMRQCSRCEEWWQATPDFFVRGHKGDPLGLHSWCKACTTEYSATRRLFQQRIEHAHGGLLHRHFVRVADDGAIEEHDHR